MKKDVKAGQEITNAGKDQAADMVRSQTGWDELWHRMRSRAAGMAPFTAEERKALRDEGRR